jgi:NADP-dependent 3-hydroxy acid dehydrogenase YdfG
LDRRRQSRHQQVWQLDILVNNAGVFIGKGIEEISLDDWNRLVAVNMTGVFLGTRIAVPALRESAKSSEHGSAIVNLPRSPVSLARSLTRFIR